METFSQKGYSSIVKHLFFKSESFKNVVFQKQFKKISPTNVWTRSVQIYFSLRPFEQYLCIEQKDTTKDILWE